MDQYSDEFVGAIAILLKADATVRLSDGTVLAPCLIKDPVEKTIRDRLDKALLDQLGIAL